MVADIKSYATVGLVTVIEVAKWCRIASTNDAVISKGVLVD